MPSQTPSDLSSGAGEPLAHKPPVRSSDMDKAGVLPLSLAAAAALLIAAVVLWRVGPSPPQSKASAPFSPPAIDFGPVAASPSLPAFSMVREFERREGPATALALAPGSRFFLTGGMDSELRLWSLETGNLMKVFPMEAPVLAAAVSPEGRRGAAATASGSLHLFSLQRRAELAALGGPGGEATCAVLSRGGDLVAHGNARGDVLLWNGRDQRLLKSFEGVHEGGTSGVGFLNGASLLLSAGRDGAVLVWSPEAEAGEALLRSMRGHDGPVEGLDCSPEGRRAATAGRDGTVRLWDAETGLEVCRFESDSPGRCVAFSPDGRRLASGHEDGSIRVWETEPSRWSEPPLEMPCHEGPVRSVAFGVSASRIFTAGEDGAVRSWRIEPVGEVLRFQSKDALAPLLGAVFAGDFVVAAGNDGSARVWNARTGLEEDQPLPAQPGYIAGLAASPDGKQVLTASSKGAVKLWDLAKRSPLLALHGHRGLVSGAAFSPDGKLAATAGRDGTARTWRLDDGERIAEFAGHGGLAVWSAAFSPDGRRVVSAGSDGAARVWDASTGQELAAFLGHEGEVYSAAFSPDGRLAISGGEDGVVRVWDSSSGQELRRLEGHRSKVNRVAFAAGGLRAISASGGVDDLDNSVRLWDVKAGAELERFEGHGGAAQGFDLSPEGLRLVSCGSRPAVRGGAAGEMILWRLPAWPASAP